MTACSVQSIGLLCRVAHLTHIDHRSVWEDVDDTQRGKAALCVIGDGRCIDPRAADAEVYRAKHLAQGRVRLDAVVQPDVVHGLRETPFLSSLVAFVLSLY